MDVWIERALGAFGIDYSQGQQSIGNEVPGLARLGIGGVINDIIDRRGPDFGPDSTRSQTTCDASDRMTVSI
jgi:hypothetical protein